ncbi:UNVERIFIED_CONTAM: General transcription and DNA repair factor IIH subunit TFB1-3 [Sesamum angustifolium]|uniref:General transcription and DNA repair factor IIH subunit TFB1-3 n=1 Tax=Sesamum angustifolium TaxID=2727405 RepID=A0AAW2KXZ2_9LAMI
MTEKEFWTKYSRAEYLHSTKNVVAAAAEAAEDEELAVFLKRDDMLANEARRKMSSWGIQGLLLKPLSGQNRVLNGLTQNISSTKLHLGNNPHESVLDRLPKVTKEELMHEIKESVQSDSSSLLVHPMLQALDAAFAYYDADVQKRSGRSGERPNGSV